MVDDVTIDQAGRLVIPKSFRVRLSLTPGTRLHITELDGRLVLSPSRPEPRLVERDGFLVLDLGGLSAARIDPEAVREDRLRELVQYALQR